MWGKCWMEILVCVFNNTSRPHFGKFISLQVYFLFWLWFQVTFVSVSCTLSLSLSYSLPLSLLLSCSHTLTHSLLPPPLSYQPHVQPFPRIIYTQIYPNSSQHPPPNTHTHHINTKQNFNRCPHLEYPWDRQGEAWRVIDQQIFWHPQHERQQGCREDICSGPSKVVPGWRSEH